MYNSLFPANFLKERWGVWRLVFYWYCTGVRWCALYCTVLYCVLYTVDCTVSQSQRNNFLYRKKKNAPASRTMASFAALRTVARRRLATPLFTAQRQHQRRGLALGGHHGPAPEWKGVDKVVRGYFPEDYKCTYFKIPNSV
jgi:hypothetical protein